MKHIMLLFFIYINNSWKNIIYWSNIPGKHRNTGVCLSTHMDYWRQGADSSVTVEAVTHPANAYALHMTTN